MPQSVLDMALAGSKREFFRALGGRFRDMLFKDLCEVLKSEIKRAYKTHCFIPLSTR